MYQLILTDRESGEVERLEFTTPDLRLKHFDTVDVHSCSYEFRDPPEDPAEGEPQP